MFLVYRGEGGTTEEATFILLGDIVQNVLLLSLLLVKVLCLVFNHQGGRTVLDLSSILSLLCNYCTLGWHRLIVYLRLFLVLFQ